jgi:hypothetical protein
MVGCLDKYALHILAKISKASISLSILLVSGSGKAAGDMQIQSAST